MEHSSGEGAACEYKEGRPVEIGQGYVCCFHKQMPCGMQGEPVTYEDTFTFTLYPCNAPQMVRAERQEAGGLELKLAPGSA